MSEELPDTSLRAGKLQHLVRNDSVSAHNPKWSRFVRRMRLVLPLIALALFAVVFVWSDIQRNDIIPVQDAAKEPTVGRNELVNPKFESTDSDNQPFTITAKRAVRGETDENLVLMDEPLADMLMNSGEWVAIKSEKGSFRQDTRMLLLRGKVHIYHDKGYHLETEELDLDLQKNTAFTKSDVHAQGPEGTLESKGLEGQADAGRIVFNGPAKLIITKTTGGPAEMLP